MADQVGIHMHIAEHQQEEEEVRRHTVVVEHNYIQVVGNCIAQVVDMHIAVVHH